MRTIRREKIRDEIETDGQQTYHVRGWSKHKQINITNKTVVA